MVNSTDFAKRLGEILEFYGITATAFSEMLQVNRSTISHLLSGRNKPSLEFVLKVLKTFPEVELYWLLNGEGHFPTPTTKQNSEPSATQNVSPSLFEQQKDNTTPTTLDSALNPSNNQPSKSPDTDFGDIERIVVFYRNGKFKTYTQ